MYICVCVTCTDRRGLATGLALSAFGGGALVATPINQGYSAVCVCVCVCVCV
jgi:hypothetical protein